MKFNISPVTWGKTGNNDLSSFSTVSRLVASLLQLRVTSYQHMLDYKAGTAACMVSCNSQVNQGTPWRWNSNTISSTIIFLFSGIFSFFPFVFGCWKAWHITNFLHTFSFSCPTILCWWETTVHLLLQCQRWLWHQFWCWWEQRWGGYCWVLLCFSSRWSSSEGVLYC